MRLAIVVNSFPTLSESFIFNKVMGLRAAGLDVAVLAHSYENDLPLFAEQLAGQSLNFVTYSLGAGGRQRRPMALGATLLWQPAQAAHLWQQVRARYGRSQRAVKAWVLALPLVLGKYELIHFEFSGLAVSYLDVLPLLAPAKLLTSCRGSAEQITPLVQPDRASKLRHVFSLMDRVHCVSTDMQRTVQAYGLRPEQAFINHPAIDLSHFQRQRPYPVKVHGPYQLLSTGRLHWKKGFEYAMLAVRQLLDENYDVRYRILGSGPEEERLRFAIHDLGLTQHVQLHDRQPLAAVRQALETADIYLLPSLSEGLSNAALEAMAMELPLVSTDAGGMAEAITQDYEGFLVPPRQPAAMAAKIKLLLGDAELRRRMGTAGRQRIERHFSLDQQVGRFIAEYRALLAEKRALAA